MSLSIHSEMSRKSFFITGGTGFVGKVMLFKLLKEFPDLEAVYLLTRGKHSRREKRFMSAQERLEKEVMGSPCFDPLRESMGAEKFKALSSRVIGMEGNITDDRLGLSDKDCQTIIQSVHFIVHMAATVNFNERLDVALRINTLGGLRVLALAKECRKLESMVHVSTCYVNYSRNGKHGTVEEVLYALPFDAESMVKYLLSLHSNEVDVVSERLLAKYGFPNTYTFTKSMGEHLIRASKGHCPVAIVRPSIVGCSYREPVPGWVDALTAAGGLLLTTGLGIVKEVNGRQDCVADIVPVDFVVNTVIKVLFKMQQHSKQRRVGGDAATPRVQAKKPQAVGEALLSAAIPPGALDAKSSVGKKGAAAAAPLIAVTAKQQQKQQQQQQNAPPPLPLVGVPQGGEPPFVYQVGTSSSLNNLTWERLGLATNNYWDWNRRHPKAFAPMTVCMIESAWQFKLRFFLLREVPYQLFRLQASLPRPIGSAEKQEFAKRVGKAISRSKSLNEQFSHFTTIEWFFSTRNTEGLDEGLDERSQNAFYFDTYMINWWFYAQVYSHGMLKYILKDTGSYAAPELPQAPTDIFKRASAL